MTDDERFDLAKATAERNRRMSMLVHAEQTQLHLFATSLTASIILVLFLAYVFFGMAR